MRMWLLAVLLLSACVALAVPAQDGVKLPDTPAGRQTAALMKALEKPDRAVIRAFIEKHFAAEFLKQIPLEQHINVNLGFAESTGGMTLLKVEKSEPYTTTILVRTGRGERMRGTVSVETEAPHAIRGIGYSPVDEVAESAVGKLPKGKLSDAQIQEALDRLVTEYTAADQFSGAVLLAKEGKVMYEKATGLASRAYNVPNRPDTRFNLGSMNKMITSVAIAQLVEKGKLTYEDTVGKLLPNYPNKDVAAKVTVHHLLTHTSGIGDYFNEKFMEASRARFRTVNDYLPLFQEQPLEFEPGARFRYSNAGFMLLGSIIEKVSGRDYFEYVRDNIYKPAGMTDTDAYALDDDPPNLAVGYTREDGGSGPRRTNSFLHVIKGGPAGGGYSTVRDLLKFDQALRSGKILSAAAFQRILDPKKQDRGGYGYGFDVRRVGDQRIAGHGGGFPGLNGDLSIYLDSGYTVAVLANYDPPAAGRIADFLRRAITQK